MHIELPGLRAARAGFGGGRGASQVRADGPALLAELKVLFNAARAYEKRRDAAAGNRLLALPEYNETYERLLPLIKGEIPAMISVHSERDIRAAIAVKEAMDAFGIKGTIKVFGSPAEEIVASRPYMIRAGLFEGVDAVIDNHSSSGFGTDYGVSGNALFSTIFTFKGKTAHAAGAPWVGRSALDAVEIMNVATNYLREHLPLSQRMHYVILEGGEAPNVVPDRASVWYYVRNTDEQLEDMYRRVVDCAKAGALAAGVELASMRVVSAVHQRHANKAEAELIQKNIEIVGMPAWSEEEQAFAKALQKELGVEPKGMPKDIDKLEAPSGVAYGGGSSDVGDVSLIAPTATVGFPGSVPGSIGHHWSAVACFYGSTAWKGLNAGAKAIAASAVDLLTRPEELAKLRQEFEEYSKTHPYKPFLPADAQPPNDLNKELMDKYRGLLEKALGHL
jgi:aminobenzoyl-glutamate utilization protein B